MADQLPKEVITEYKKVFEQFDQDNDGLIATTDLGSILKALGQNHMESEVLDMVNELGADNTGTIDFPELLSLLAWRFPGSDYEDVILNEFKAYDREGKGVISLDDLGHALLIIGENLTPDEIDEMTKEAKVDSDGNVNYVEFLRMIMNRG